MKRHGQYGRKASWMGTRFGKYRRKVNIHWNDMENMEEQ
jgi:hypothetical protein